MYSPSIHGRLTTRPTLEIQGGSKTGTLLLSEDTSKTPHGRGVVEVAEDRSLLVQPQLHPLRWHIHRPAGHNGEEGIVETGHPAGSSKLPSKPNPAVQTT